jgi:fatty acid desaturase
MPASVQAQAHHLVRDLHTPNLGIYWTDMLLTAALGWTAFAIAVLSRLWSWPMLLASFVSVCALYRGLCFLHEVTHLRAGVIRRFEAVWNVLFGIPLLLPSFMYVGVHQFHHNLATYGTEGDPEYLPFSGKPLMIAVFIAQGLLIPLLLVVRFFLLAPLSWVFPAVHRWLCVHFSALSMNVKFCREVSAEVSLAIRRSEVLIVTLCILLSIVCTFVYSGWRWLWTWYAVSAGVAVTNTIRALGAHRYTSEGKPLERDEQLIDSIDTPGRFWTELWAPVGLRYHALHHYFPGIPYHNLGKAYRTLTANLPPDAWYRLTTSPGLPSSLRTLCEGEHRSGLAPESALDRPSA